MNKKYMCPVCGFGGLEEPPYNQQNIPSHEICSCCGFEFGFDGENNPTTFVTFRQNWIKKGSPWFMPNQKPKKWDLERQLSHLKG